MKLRNIVAMTLVIYQVCVYALREFVTTLPVLRVLAIVCMLFIVHLVSSFNTTDTYPFIFDKFIGLTLYFASDHQIVNTCILLALLFGVDHLILEPGLMGWNWVFNVYYVCVTWIFIVKEPRDKLKVCGVQACVVVSAGSIILTPVLLASLFSVYWRCSFDSLLLVVCLSNPKSCHAVVVTLHSRSCAGSETCCLCNTASVKQNRIFTTSRSVPANHTNITHAFQPPPVLALSPL